MTTHGLVSAVERDGVLYLLGNNKPEDVRESKLMAQADLVVDFANGAILKNRRGPIKPRDASIEDRLLLAQSRAYELWGHVDGCGFAVRVDLDLSNSESWGIFRHYGDLLVDYPSAGEGSSVLVVKDGEGGDGSYAWAPWAIRGGARFDSNLYSLVSIEHDRSAIVLALNLCDGRSRPVELEPYLSTAADPA